MEKTKRLVGVKVLLLILYLLTTAIILCGFLYGIKLIENDKSVGVVYVLVGLFHGGLSYLVCTLISIFGLIKSIELKYGKLNVVLFVVGIILPILTELSFVLWAFLY